MAIQDIQNLGLDNVSDSQKVEILKKINTDLRSSLDEFISILSKFSEAISTKFDLKVLLNHVADFLNDVIEYVALTITVYDPLRDNFSAVHVRNLTPAIDAKIKNLINDGLAKWALDQKRCVAMPDMENAEGNSTIIIIPLITQSKTIGAVFMYCDKSPESFIQQELEFVNILGAQAAIAMQNTLLYREMENKNLDLANLKNYLNDVINNMVTGVLVVGSDDSIKTFNHVSEKLLALKAQTVLGNRFDAALPRSLSDRIFSAMTLARNEDVYRESGEYRPEVEFDYEVEGRAIPLRMSYSNMKDSTGEALGTIFMLQDMSESREIRRLKEIDKIKSELVANVSHELRTPLTSIKAYAETLLDIVGTEEVDTQKEFLGIICQESERLTNLISNLLDLSRLESGDFKIDRSEANLGELIKKCAMLLKEHAAQKKISLKIELPKETSPVMIDASKIEQVLINLISNAIKYNKPEGGEVAISLKQKEKSFEIVVRDNGIGIPKDALTKIFEKFFRVDSSLTYQVSGTGLGLAIVKHIVDLHQGQISVESALNAGTSFTVVLPRY